ncbi:MAG TPA: hypothetical protein VMW41_03595 [Candidatus Bathyarchaeia archaeon]|nr:hypothetical protein [Candidatus Bathyarchaeia archaeon]
MSKRKKIIATSLLLSIGLVLIQTRIIHQRYLAILILSILSWLLSAWTLREGLKGIGWLTVLMLPCLFTASIGLFYFLLPAQLVARIPIIILYALGIYILLLTENIFSIASFRNIQLLRSAQATGFLLTLITAFFLFDTAFSFRLDPWANFIVILIITFFLALQALWSVSLEGKVTFKLIYTSLVAALVLSEIGLVVSFWPMAIPTSSLFLITVLYILLGLIQSKFQEKLFRNTVKEYLYVGMAVFVMVCLTTKWGG